jgi:hypothetical protein
MAKGLAALGQYLYPAFQFKIMHFDAGLRQVDQKKQSLKTLYFMMRVN